MPPDKRKGPLAGGPLQKNVDFAGLDRSDHTADIEVSQLLPRPIGPGELAHLRAMWWRQAGLGHRLPAELEVIVIAGGRL